MTNVKKALKDLDREHPEVKMFLTSSTVFASVQPLVAEIPHASGIALLAFAAAGLTGAWTTAEAIGGIKKHFKVSESKAEQLYHKATGSLSKTIKRDVKKLRKIL